MRSISVLIGVVLLTSSTQVTAQGNESVPPLFATDVPLELTIEGPFNRLSRDGRERPERPSVLRYRDEQGEEVVLDVDIRIRGNSRLDICAFPPLRLDFPRTRLEGTVFAGQNRLKLVTLCRDQNAFKDYLAQEYQIYIAFNALTENSFRVRRANIQYVETEGRNPDTFSQEAFLIEEDWAVADRVGMSVLETEIVAVSDLNARHMSLLSLFHFMIGSTDWSAIRSPEGEDCCHNGAALHNSDAGVFVIPYDFDQTGIINTSYAKPSPVLPIRRVTQRLYRGICSMNDGLDWAVTRLNERRDAVIAAFDSERVRERQRNRALEYIRESYEIINDAERFNEEILEACRG